MFRKTFYIAVILIVIVAVFVFTKLNTGPITIDLAFASFDTQKPIAFIVAFAAGAGFGVLCSTVFTLKVVNDRRRVRKSLRLAEAEVSSLRSLPLQDAGD